MLVHANVIVHMSKPIFPLCFLLSTIVRPVPDTHIDTCKVSYPHYSHGVFCFQSLSGQLQILDIAHANCYISNVKNNIPIEFSVFNHRPARSRHYLLAHAKCHIPNAKNNIFAWGFLFPTAIRPTPNTLHWQMQNVISPSHNQCFHQVFCF